MTRKDRKTAACVAARLDLGVALKSLVADLRPHVATLKMLADVEREQIDALPRSTKYDAKATQFELRFGRLDRGRRALVTAINIILEKDDDEEIDDDEDRGIDEDDES